MMTVLRTHMPFSLAGHKADAPADRSTYEDLLLKLDEGWHIEPPVYVMTDPVQRNRTVFRMVIWRDGRPQVASVHDGAEIRQFLAERRLRQEML